MEINFDLLVAGCSTRCRHCYVRGGPGPSMPSEDAVRCIRALDEIASRLSSPVSFTLDNEPFSHPGVGEILRAAASAEHAKYFHHGMTTGIALMARPDRDEVLDAYLDLGYDEFGITLHGAEEHHDGIVRRKGAFDASVRAAGWLKSRGAKVSVSLMFGRFFSEDRDGIGETLEQLAPDFVWFAVPNYTPHADMAAYEPYRGTIGDLEAFAPVLRKWRKDADAILEDAARHTPAAAVMAFEDGLSLREEFERPQDELYLSVHADCRLYVGNSGAETEYLGDLRTLDPAALADRISALPGNRDYGAFYDRNRLPSQDALVNAMKRLSPDVLYADLPSVVCRGLDGLGIPTKILACP